MKVRIIEEMRKRGVTPIDLTEFDQWVNDAIREDINCLVKEEKEVFGLKVWTYEIIPAEKLINCSNFAVDCIFRNEDKDKILKIIAEYREKEKEGFDIKAVEKFLDDIFQHVIYACYWV